MNEIKVNEGKVKKALFRIKWLTMSEKDKYAYLWKQTRESMYSEHSLYSRYGYLWRQPGEN